jgi:hypothetical protein
VQRCRAHKLRNVLDYLPKDDKPQVKSLLRAAWKLDADKGMARIRKLAAWLDRKYPQAAASLLEGLQERFTINRLDIPPALHRCLATHREPARRSAHPDPPRHSLAERQDGVALDGFGVAAKQLACKLFRISTGQSRFVAQNRENASNASWDTAIYGRWKRSSTRLRPPTRKRRSNINLTAARHFQLRAGHAQSQCGKWFLALRIDKRFCGEVCRKKYSAPSEEQKQRRLEWRRKYQKDYWKKNPSRRSNRKANGATKAEKGGK